MGDARRPAATTGGTRPQLIRTASGLGGSVLLCGVAAGGITGSWIAGATTVALGLYVGTVVIAALAWRGSRQEIAAARREEAETWKVLETLLSHAPIILSVVDRKGRLVRLQGKGLRTIEADPDRLVGRPVGEILKGMPQIRAWTRRALDGENFVDTIRVGSRTFANHVSPVVDETGEVVGAIGVATDVTSRVRAEEALRRFNSELERRVAGRTRKLRAMNAEMETFAMGASHDLRAPLRAVYGFAEALLEDYGRRLDETGKDFVRRILRASEQMDRIIEDLLAYRRVSRVPQKGRPVSLDAVVRASLSRLSSTLDPARAEVRAEGPWPDVSGHESTLVQVVSNLVANAVKFVAEGTRPRIVIRTEPRRDRVRLWVEDNGIGFEPGDRDRVFQLFERLHGIEAYPGTGVGLALVRRAVERMGGEVGVESAPGRGSRFWIELPAVRPKETEHTGSAASEPVGREIPEGRAANATEAGPPPQEPS